MGEKTGITWCHHTFNPWWVCTNVSRGCDRCYAEDLAHRLGLAWGKDAPRLFFNEKHWGEPLKWNQKAVEAKARRRVFCGSMCDILDTWTGGQPLFSGKNAEPWWMSGPPALRVYGLDMAVVKASGTWLDAARQLLWALIEATPQLDWLLLTKRPQSYASMLPQRWLQQPRRNVWIMTTVESPEYLWRLETIAKIPAAVHGVSWEPALAYVDFKPFAQVPNLWVIGGGESCAGCRPFDLAWARLVRNDCRVIGVPYFLKQLGGHPDKRSNPALWPKDLRVQEFP
jgi:protein gp37